MTPAQAERIQKKILKIRRTLAAEKRKFGVYDDSRGLRYLPLQYYIELQDFKGGLSYTRWFQKNFPDDSCFPDFLLDWTLVLFQAGKLKEAARKAFQTYASNAYLLDAYLGVPSKLPVQGELSSREGPGIADRKNFQYLNAAGPAFREWLSELTRSEPFLQLKETYDQLRQRIKMEADSETRGYLISRLYQLKKGEE